MTAILRPGLRAVLATAGAISAAVFLILAAALWSRPTDATVSLTDDVVVASLRGSAAQYSDLLRSRLRSARADPDNPATAKAAARQLVDEGRRAGDARLIGAALAVLRPVLDRPDAEMLTLAATARQYQHDFVGALDLLDQALASSPADAAALSGRASINVVTGRLAVAAADCRRLLALGHVGLGVICQSVVAMPTADAPAAYDRLEAIVARAGVLDDGLRAYARGVLGEIALLQGWNDIARTQLDRALTEDPDALRVRVLLADVLIATGDADAALTLLQGAPDVDAVLLRRASAAGRLGNRAVLKDARSELSRRFRRNLDLGLVAHAREEARFFLEIDPDPQMALGRAQANWALQHEIEDAQLLIDASVAAGMPDAAAPVLRWITEEKVSVPTLRLAAEGGR